MNSYINHPNYQRYFDIIKSNSPVAYGGTKLFDGDRDYLMQIPEEFSSTLCFFHDEFGFDSINLLEIGTASNLTNTMFWNNFKVQNNVIVDALLCPNVEKSLFGNLQFKPGTVFIIGDSTSSDVQTKVSKLELQYDLVFCDGNHEYEYVKKDYKYYSQLVKPGGYFLFHDTDNWKVPGVKKFIDECSFDGFEKVVEFKTTKYENTCGIGIYRRTK